MPLVEKRAFPIPRFKRVDDPQLSEGQQKALGLITDAFNNVENAVLQVVPEGRYRAAAFTVLEQAAMLFSKAVTHEGA